ncbi:hypothetical protein OB955_12875 [Halobacteria archaeon AArc-m2/3/4]|uniref:Uncharacterized protein n=1 Tax=Natronoglomus mannanivorans TaxID=2979990 RepID=A0AAP3E135_9EURY|nr:hypothetical protein [Halobacteria archaeon AArc-xg1-1]MCU4973627.1 hypothetical protein [Halobacteria archaeon AArc-m2/3/4]
MTESRLARFRQLRRALPLLAAGLLLSALAVPMWRITLTAPQYPGTELLVELYAYPRLEGDVREVHMLNKYVGFYYPDPVFVDPNFPVEDASIAVPEWLLGPIAFVAIAATGVFVALAPTARKLKLGLTCQLAGTVAVFAGMFAVIQYRLYQAGHSLDPDAPMVIVDEFTPPLLGSYEVANISGFAWFGPGGYLTAAALVLLVVAYGCRDSTATVGDVPALVRERAGTVRRRIERTTEEGDRTEPNESPRPSSDRAVAASDDTETSGGDLR